MIISHDGNLYEPDLSHNHGGQLHESFTIILPNKGFYICMLIHETGQFKIKRKMDLHGRYSRKKI